MTKYELAMRYYAWMQQDETGAIIETDPPTRVMATLLIMDRSSLAEPLIYMELKKGILSLRQIAHRYGVHQRVVGLRLSRYAGAGM